MRHFPGFFLSISLLLSLVACDKTKVSVSENGSNSTGLKIAYVNGDSILNNFTEFKAESEAMEIRQRQAEEDLQKKGAALEKEFMAYQQRAQKGTMTGKEMEAQERYLSGKQEAILAERDKIAKEILSETSAINDRLQKVIHDILNEIKEEEGYDFIMSYIEGGPILVANEKYDITERVLNELNKTSSGDTTPPDTTKA
ncbi:MAG: OmpH family outer membrane protein, partial [Saprospiraceae bacterium]